MSDIKPTKQFWMVIKDGTAYVSKRHDTEEEAVREAVRLTMKENKKFYVMKTVGEVHPMVSALFGKY